MTKMNGTVHWKWLGPVITLVAFSLVSYIGHGVASKADANEIRIQRMETNLAVQKEILVRIETKIDSLVEKER